MSEKDEQIAFIQWVDIKKQSNYRYRTIFATPNGAWLAGDNLQRSRLMRSLKNQGLRPGVPDIFVAWATAKYGGLFLEFKFGKNETSEHQDEWISLLKMAGYKVNVVYSFEEAKDIVEKYLEG